MTKDALSRMLEFMAMTALQAKSATELSKTITDLCCCMMVMAHTAGLLKNNPEFEAEFYRRLKTDVRDRIGPIIRDIKEVMFQLNLGKITKDIAESKIKAIIDNNGLEHVGLAAVILGGPPSSSEQQ